MICRAFCGFLLLVSGRKTKLKPVDSLDKLDFGLGAAQQEQQLRQYFYRSGSFKLACSEKTYLILGAKGAGKSAIFRMFKELEKEMGLFASPNLWVSDEPLLRVHWDSLQKAGQNSQVTLWRFYVASLVAKHFLRTLICRRNCRRATSDFLFAGVWCERSPPHGKLHDL